MDVPLDLDRDELLTLTEAAHRLRVNPATVYRWAMSNRLACWRRGGRLVTTRAAVDALLVPVRPVAFRQEQRAQQVRDRWTEERLREAGLL
ncbi:MAG: helix-turn-helix domain-containing protein [Pseudomonadota bacterium]